MRFPRLEVALIRGSLLELASSFLQRYDVYPAPQLIQFIRPPLRQLTTLLDVCRPIVCGADRIAVLVRQSGLDYVVPKLPVLVGHSTEKMPEAMRDNPDSSA